MKLLKNLLAIMLVVALLSGCSANNSETTKNDSVQKSTQPDNSTSGEGEGPIEIKFSYINPSAGYEAVMDAYNKMQDKVQVKSYGIEENYDPLMQKLVLQASANQLPDIYTSGYNVNQFGIDNFPVVPVQTFIDKENYDLSDFFPKLLDLGRGENGKLYGLPLSVSSTIMYINEDLFNAAGLDPKNLPKTWDELRTTAKKLTKGDQYGFYFDYISSSGTFFFEGLLATAGGEMINDSKKAGFNSPAGKRALQFLCDLQSDGSMPNMTRAQADQLFLSGKLAVYVTVSNRLQVYKDANFKLGTAVSPSADGVSRKIPTGGNDLFIISKDPKVQAAAWDFIKYCASPEGTALFTKTTGTMAVRKSAVEKPELLGDYLKNTPNAMTGYNQVDDLIRWSVFPKEDPQIQKALSDNIVAAVQKQKTVDQALKDAEEQANALLK